MQLKPGDRQRARREFHFQLLLERARNLGRDLVLDGDVRTPSAAVLGAQQPVQAGGGGARTSWASRVRTSASADGGSAWNMVKCAGSRLRSGG
jgi:hypothetical protein